MFRLLVYSWRQPLRRLVTEKLGHRLLTIKVGNLLIQIMALIKEASGRDQKCVPDRIKGMQRKQKDHTV